MPDALRLVINWKVFMGIVTGVSAVLLMFNQVGALEGYWVAHRDWVREYVMRVGNPVSEQLATLADLQYGTQVTVIEESLKQLRRERVEIEIQLQDELKPATTRLLRTRLEEVDAGIQHSEERVRVLRCALEPGSAWCN